MFIEKIELKNYRCYSNLIKEFTDGLNVISGENGIGKTTIVESIAYALFGNKLTRGKANSWIKKGCKHGQVKLYLDDHIILRGDNEQYIENSDGIIVARQHVGVDEWIDKTYGINSDLFSTSNYIAQKDIESFSYLQAAERIKRVETLLRIDVLDKLKKKSKDKITLLKADEKHLEGKVLTAQEQAKQYDITNLLTKIQEKTKLLEIADKVYEEKLKLYITYEDNLIKWNKKKSLRSKIQFIKYTSFDHDLAYYLGVKKDLEENEILQKDLDKLKHVNARNDQKLIESIKESYLEAKLIYKQLENVTKVCPTCQQNIPDAAVMLKKRVSASKDMQTYKEKGICAVERTQKFTIKSKIKKYKYSIEEILQIIKDYQLQNIVTQYNEIEAIEPEVIDISKERQTKVDAKKDLDSLKLSKYSYDSSTKILETYEDLYNKTIKDLCNLKEFVKFVDQYRKEFSQNVIPLIEDNAKIIFHLLTEDKFNDFTIKKDYSIENYDEFSGSEADSAALALRMAIAKVSRIGKFNSIILDEVAASFDTNKENLLLELLKTTTKSNYLYITWRTKLMSNPYIVVKETNYKQKLRVFAGSEEEARLKIVNGEGFPVNVNDQPEVTNVNMSNWPTLKDTVFEIDNSHSIILFISGNVKNCPYCSAAQAFFKSFGLQIQVVDIAVNVEERDRIIKESGNDRIPKLEIDGKLETGFNPNATTEILLKSGVLNTKQSMTKEK